MAQKKTNPDKLNADKLNPDKTSGEYEPLLEPVDFEFDGLHYRYDFNRVTTEQAVLATEVMQFKYEQIENKQQIQNFEQIKNSGGIQYYWRCAAYLLVKMENGQPMPFLIERCESETEKFVRSLPVALFRAKIDQCLEDFFLREGKPWLASTGLSRPRKLDAMQILSSMLQSEILLKNGNVNAPA